ncbi:MAG TPA: YgeY family selenium metabolism-linked hydrolase, partial [Petrotogaceae bacterium]|nr:YgeY family selenium metabolism-linked hydrolase [Petrotogaceae bacterium]
MNPVMQRAKELEPLITGFMQKLIRAKSFSAQEKEVTDLICAQMTQNGFDEVYKDGLGNVIGRIG